VAPQHHRCRGAGIAFSVPGRSIAIISIQRKAFARNIRQEQSMLDVVGLGLGFSFFLLAVGYTYACERL
jgi:hypothetical protein